MNHETPLAQGPVECRVMHSFTEDGRRWTACSECNRGGNGNDKDNGDRNGTETRNTHAIARD